MMGWPSGYPPTPTCSKSCPRSAIAESSSKAPENGPAGLFASPPITKTSLTPSRPNRHTISSRCVLPVTSRAAMCGTIRKPLASNSSPNSRVLSMPCVGEQVMVTFAPSGRWAARSLAPSIGISSNLGRASASTRASFLASLISTVPEEVRRARAGTRRGSDSVRFARLPSQIRLGGLLPRVYERLLHNPGRGVTHVRPDREFGSRVSVLDGHQGEPYVLFQPRGPERRGDLPDLRAVLDDLQVILYVPYQRVTLDLDPDHLAADPLVRDAL